MNFFLNDFKFKRNFFYLDFTRSSYFSQVHLHEILEPQKSNFNNWISRQLFRCSFLVSMLNMAE